MSEPLLMVSLTVTQTVRFGFSNAAQMFMAMRCPACLALERVGLGCCAVHVALQLDDYVCGSCDCYSSTEHVQSLLTH